MSNNQVSRRAETSRLPRLPSAMPSALGPVRVRRSTTLMARKGALGVFDVGTRRVTVQAGLSRLVAWQVYYHEHMHVALWDAGLRLSRLQEEMVCDLVGNLRARDVRCRRAYRR